MPGSTGAAGATGPSSRVLLGTITLAETAIIAISAGIRKITFAAPGVVLGDDILLSPVSALPTGYAIHNAVSIAPAGNLSVTLSAPLLAIGAGYSIPCRVLALR